MSLVTAYSQALGESCTVPRWVVEFCEHAHDDAIREALWQEHVKGPAEVAQIIDYARIVCGRTRQEACEIMDAFLARHDA